MISLTPWVLRDRTFNWGQKTYLMGILNVTPDSFSDGGQFNSVASALQQARELAAVVDILDIGGQSTRPQAVEIDLETELERVIPVIKAIRQELTIPISIDTTRADVARDAIANGADLINDVSGGTYDPLMFTTAAQLGVPIILMHLRGTPKTMQQLTDYDDLIIDIMTALEQQIAAAIAAGVEHSKIAIDPGIGFAKTGPQNLEILKRLQTFQSIGCPILVGPSRKSFIGHILGKDNPQDRVWGTAAACCGAISGQVDILRVHDGAAMADVCRVADAIWREPREKTLLQ